MWSRSLSSMTHILTMIMIKRQRVAPHFSRVVRHRRSVTLPRLHVMMCNTSQSLSLFREVT
ncbi:hypothetical protein RHRU231_370027 [Rhodococcus ruber]|uniref:Uncharacterized protein n=1 Tax=Rhodococcus ruber TaxID=1830 RepID=A0A098BIE8_9NOCA|nr:hypothetical protein RHRU231_370027 [Rhodococcus ruber]